MPAHEYPPLLQDYIRPSITCFWSYCPNEKVPCARLVLECLVGRGRHRLEQLMLPLGSIRMSLIQSIPDLTIIYSERGWVEVILALHGLADEVDSRTPVAKPFRC